MTTVALSFICTVGLFLASIAIALFLFMGVEK